MKITTPMRIVAFIEKNGPVTISQVVAAVGRFVSAASAQRASDREYRRKRGIKGYSSRRKDPAVVGRRKITTEMLGELKDRGLIRRVSVGVYGPRLRRRRA